MRSFRDWSIRHKLTGLFVTMALIALLTTSVPLGILDYMGLNRAKSPDLGGPSRCSGPEQHRLR
jgi:hypothetical protein